uniref:Uncharacterized protein n=1 Tax=Romanomermis culicivorax TaxID=13658 RepID=A0A915JIA5_ROMCU
MVGDTTYNENVNLDSFPTFFFFFLGFKPPLLANDLMDGDGDAVRTDGEALDDEATVTTGAIVFNAWPLETLGKVMATG